MTDNCCHHSGNRCNGLEINDTVQDVSNGNVVTPPVGSRVKEKANHLDGVECNMVAEVLGFDMKQFDIELFLGVVTVMKLSMVHVFHAITFQTERMTTALLEMCGGAAAVFVLVLLLLFGEINRIYESVERDGPPGLSSVI